MSREKLVRLTIEVTPECLELLDVAKAQELLLHLAYSAADGARLVGARVAAASDGIRGERRIARAGARSAVGAARGEAVMPLADAKAIVELANDVAILAERVDGEEGRAVLEKHAATIAEARRIVSSTKERASADVGDLAACPSFVDVGDWSCDRCGFSRADHYRGVR